MTVLLVVIVMLRCLVQRNIISELSGLYLLITCLLIGVLQVLVPLQGSFWRPLQLVTCGVSTVALCVNASYFWSKIRGAREDYMGK